MSTRLAPTTIKTRVVVVRSAFAAAVADKVVASDPSQGLTLPRRRKQEAATRVPTVEEVGRLLASADDGFRAYVALCAFAGLRMGEACGVRVGDIDFLRRQLTVSRQLQRDGRDVAVVPPKYGSERAVHLPDELVQVLGEHVARHAPGDDADRWLFTAYDKPVHNKRVTFLWRRTRKAAAAQHVRLHDFYASGLISQGCDVVTVQRPLGHSTATTTLNTYSHLWPTAEDRTRAAASSLMRDALAISADSVRTEEVR